LRPPFVADEELTVSVSVTLYFADQKPADAPDGNWLPTPKGQQYN
jgi:hypothetical protein